MREPNIIIFTGRALRLVTAMLTAALTPEWHLCLLDIFSRPFRRINRRGITDQVGVADGATSAEHPVTLRA